MEAQCSICHAVQEFDPYVIKARRAAGLETVKCHYCRGMFKPVPIRRGRSDDQKRSQAQEKKAAKRLGAKRQKGSGSQPGAKGDIRKPGELRGECKFTRAKSFTLKLADLMKLESEATSGENTVFEIEFQGNPTKRYAVIPGWLYDYYAGIGERNECD